MLNRVLRHNLRNEMNVIYGYAEQLPDSETGVRIQERAMEMANMGGKAREINNVLDEDAEADLVDVTRLLGIQLHRLHEAYPAIEFDVSRPERSAKAPSTFATTTSRSRSGTTDRAS